LKSFVQDKKSGHACKEEQEGDEWKA